MAYLTVMGEKGHAETRYMAIVPELVGKLTLADFSLEAPPLTPPREDTWHGTRHDADRGVPQLAAKDET